MQNIPDSVYSIENIQKILKTSEIFIDEAAKIANKYFYSPMPGSQAEQELNAFPENRLLIDAYSRGSICFESAADHFMAYISTLQEPAKTLSPYTCIRSMLESSALALWLYDINIDARERVGRCFGFRYKEFTEQLKFFESNKLNSPDAQVHIDKTTQRIKDVEKLAISLGYSKLSKDEKITGIATHMPGIVTLVKTTLNRESEYRLLSGVAHSYLWATRQVGFKVIEIPDGRGQEIKVLEKHVHPEMIVFGINLAIPTFAKVFWTIGKLLGWDMNEVEALLSHTFDEAGFNNYLRFWHQH